MVVRQYWTRVVTWQQLVQPFSLDGYEIYCLHSNDIHNLMNVSVSVEHEASIRIGKNWSDHKEFINLWNDSGAF